MIQFDEFTFNLPRLWIAVCLLVFVDLICVSSLGIGNPVASWFIQWLPREAAFVLQLFGPFVVAVIWLILVVLGAVYHGRDALWLLVPGLVILPLSYLGSVLLACATFGACP